mmetsp:Transcript_9168/g.18605  ORF Transcript_9168/g.18605 Transcript_9168/m.18605 type:complete len:234 (-) Transcript_9168:144-845(-)
MVNVLRFARPRVVWQRSRWYGSKAMASSPKSPGDENRDRPIPASCPMGLARASLRSTNQHTPHRRHGGVHFDASRTSSGDGAVPNHLRLLLTFCFYSILPRPVPGDTPSISLFPCPAAGPASVSSTQVSTCFCFLSGNHARILVNVSQSAAINMRKLHAILNGQLVILSFRAAHTTDVQLRQPAMSYPVYQTRRDPPSAPSRRSKSTPNPTASSNVTTLNKQTRNSGLPHHLE